MIKNNNYILTFRNAIGFLILNACVFVTVSSQGQESNIEEVLVTIQKRAQAIQDVPLSITALSGDLIADTNLDDYKDLVAFTPGLTGNSKDSFTDFLQIRGIYTTDYGVGGDPSISFFKNGIYQGRSGAMVTSLYDIDRAEVARGSQGFLVGRNSIAGAIDVFTTRPSFTQQDAYIEVDTGERDRRTIEAASNIQLGENLAARLAVYKSQEDGYVTDAFNPSNDDLIGHNKKGARLSLLSEFANTDVNFTAEIEDRQQSGTVYRAIPVGETWDALVDLFDVSLGGDANDAYSDFSQGQGDNSEIWSLGLQIDHELGWATLTSITSYKEHTWSYAEDYDGTALRIADYTQQQEGDYMDQEIRLVSNSEGPFSWLGGITGYSESVSANFSQVADEEIMCAFYLSEDGYANCSEYLADYDEVFTPNPNGLVESNIVQGNYSGFAAYFDTQYQLTDTLDISIGARYTKDNKRFANHALPVESDLGPFYGIGYTTDGFLRDSKSWSDTSPRVVLRYQPNSEWMLYGSVTQGYKAGGFGSFAVTPEPEFGELDLTQANHRPATYQPENVTSFEVGSKHTLAGGLTRLDLSVYQFSYTDLQSVVEGAGGGIRVDNIGKVESWGIEGSLDTALGENWDLLFTAAWAGSEMNRVQALCDGEDTCEGKKLPSQPQFSYGFILQGHYPAPRGQWLASIDAFGQSETYGGFNRNPLFKTSNWTEMAARFGYQSNEGWEIMTYLENALDEEYFDGVSDDVGILPAYTFGPSRPRTAGVRVTWEFL